MNSFTTHKPSVMVLGHSPADLMGVTRLLQDLCILHVGSEDHALGALKGAVQPVDLILLDADQPDAHDVCRQLKNHTSTRQTPVILIGQDSHHVAQTQGFDSGASDYLVRPLHPTLFVARIRALLAVHTRAAHLDTRNAQLEQAAAQHAHEIDLIQEVTILSLTSLAQTRDAETGNHIRRTQHYMQALSRQLKNHPRFSHFLSDPNINLLFKSAPLHDIGKVGIPDRILLKAGRLSADEMDIMKTHTTQGRDAIEQAERLLGTQMDFLNIAKEIAYAHHEKWDGSGYPLGLQGDAIPISARLMALADVYDAIISRRVYKAGMTHQEAVAIIAQAKGQHFDPDVVEAFLGVLDEFLAISVEYADTDDDMDSKLDYLIMASVA